MVVSVCAHGEILTSRLFTVTDCPLDGKQPGPRFPRIGTTPTPPGTIYEVVATAGCGNVVTMTPSSVRRADHRLAGPA